jgi:hypothetical protein
VLKNFSMLGIPVTTGIKAIYPRVENGGNLFLMENVVLSALTLALSPREREWLRIAPVLRSIVRLNPSLVFS